MAENDCFVNCEGCQRLFLTKELVLVITKGDLSKLLCTRCLVYFCGRFERKLQGERLVGQTA